MATFEAGGRFFRVHKRVAPIFKAFINELVRREPPPGGYRINAGAVDDGGYNCRKIRDPVTGLETNTWSNHAWGLAVDINSNTNPHTTTLITNMPAWVRDEKFLMRKYGLRWGGTYSSKPDPMHYEFLLTPADADRIARTLEDDMTVEEFVREMSRPGSPARKAIRELAGKAVDDQLATPGSPARVAIRELAGKAVDDQLSTRGTAAREGIKDLLDTSVGGLQTAIGDLHTKIDTLAARPEPSPQP